jgi:dihydroxy-acid dehydratase
MEPSNEVKAIKPEEPRFLNFPHLPDDAKYPDGKPALNKHSSTVTRGHEFPGAQVGSVDSACQASSNPKM